MDVIAALDATFVHARGVIAGARDHHLDRPTPCTEWSVGSTTDRLVAFLGRRP